MFPESISLTTSSFSDGGFVAGLALDGIHNVGGGTAISTMDIQGPQECRWWVSQWCVGMCCSASRHTGTFLSP